eukprot:gnl/TRDRNA2_/TRDRNA2_175804_c0_seq1.p1 gnl/TRDRNA2_/TRDRNA2_175804_c0~~gnl/TRDRNA2_/TRDRNA2_175804_c0_seq1.p1  ORF type:complete len:509 (-),score=70.54 gnl/TRDRNA2_/TRDRNA2_175804_c0_seq1:349-1875(-)
MAQTVIPDVQPHRHLEHRLTVSTQNQNLTKLKYAVRGRVVEKAGEIKAQLAAGNTLPFKQIIPCNIGNPHAVKQAPVTFYRQVAACCLYPELMQSNPLSSCFGGCVGAASNFPSDVKARATEYLAGTGDSGVGAYTDSNGLLVVRRQVAAFIEARDGFPADPLMISLTTGASEGVKRCLNAIIAKDNDCCMIPRPQYPLYSAAITMFNGKMQYYNCEESRDWTVTREELDKAYTEAVKERNEVRAIAVINPGNPSGSVLSLDDVKMFITFARDKEILILADEVYQENVYAEGKQFHSFKKALRQLQQASSGYESVQIVSFHSTSKGIIGECGQRGGYCEFVGFSDRTMAQFGKVAATSLSSNTLGQIFVGLMVKPPKPGEPSYALFKKETDAIFGGLKRRAKMLTAGLNSIPGITCREVQGAMYGFACVEIPQKAQELAQREGMAADEWWCLQLVDQTGIVCVPGSGFGQEPGTHHFRITILPPDSMLEDMLKRMQQFQVSILKDFAA